MKIRILLLVFTLTMFFSGCASNQHHVTNMVNPAAYSQHPVLYEVTYDHECNKDMVIANHIYTFKKGQRFKPLVLGGYKVYMSGFSSGYITLPNDTIGLEFGKNQYIFIYPNGELISDSQQIAKYIGGETLHGKGFLQGVCKIKKGKPLFKKVEEK